jgi:hypothetical protein
MSEFKAIETTYNGYRFRSRLEARYAVLLDYVGIQYEYEREGFEVDGIRYLPDFWLPVWKTWLEVKGTKPNEEEIQKAIAVVRGTRRDLLLVVGDLGSLFQHYRFQYKWLHPDDVSHFADNPDQFGGVDAVNKIIQKGFYIYYEVVHSWEILAAIGIDPRFQDDYIRFMRSSRFEFGQSGTVI